MSDGITGVGTGVALRLCVWYETVSGDHRFGTATAATTSTAPPQPPSHSGVTGGDSAASGVVNGTGNGKGGGRGGGGLFSPSKHRSPYSASGAGSVVGNATVGGAGTSSSSNSTNVPSPDTPRHPLWGDEGVEAALSTLGPTGEFTEQHPHGQLEWPQWTVLQRRMLPGGDSAEGRRTPGGSRGAIGDADVVIADRSTTVATLSFDDEISSDDGGVGAEDDGGFGGKDGGSGDSGDAVSWHNVATASRPVVALSSCVVRLTRRAPEVGSSLIGKSRCCQREEVGESKKREEKKRGVGPGEAEHKDGGLRKTCFVCVCVCARVCVCVCV